MRDRRVAILFARPPHPVDGILDHGRRLTDALTAREGVTAALHLREPAHGWRTDPGTWGDIRGADAAVLQYNPFSYGRRGIAPWLPIAVNRLRRLPRRPVVALMAHETFVPALNWRWALMRTWHRLQLLALARSCHVIFVSVEAWVPVFGRIVGDRKIVHTPVGSNLPDGREDRSKLRGLLRAPPDCVVLATFGTGHPSHVTEHAAGAANATAAAGIPTLLLVLGHGAPAPLGLRSDVRIVRPGRLPEVELAGHLAAADILLAPFVDGVSSRRTTIMSALQHGVAVASTDGHLTDSALRAATSALTLVPAGDAEAFAAAVVELARSPHERSARGAAGRALYEAEFDWPIVAERIDHALWEFGPS